jgi:maleylpyruvate isomerase
VTVPTELLEEMAAGEAFVLAQVHPLDDAGFAEPSRLPGWTRAHIVAHLARNADALCNLLAWARTGVETPMYPSREKRADDIETGATQAPAVLRAELVTASERLAGTASDHPDEAWEAEVRTASNRRIPASEVPWMRMRETWVHAVDLGLGAAFDDVPASVVVRLLDEVAGGLADRADCPAMVLAADDAHRSWTVGPSGPTVTVRGTGPRLLAWLIGRDTGDGLHSSDGRPPPQSPPWL